MNCTTSVTSLLQHSSGRNGNALLCVINNSADKAFNALMDYVTKNIDKIVVGTSWDEAAGLHPKKSKKPDFMAAFVETRGTDQSYTAFELAIVKGNTKVIILNSHSHFFLSWLVHF
jgi:hypothetical protein